MNIKCLRNYLKLMIGHEIRIVYYGSRNRKERYSGVLYRVYNNVFSIKLCNGDIKSFTYGDILTKTVQIYI